jgi:hypothetical protein
MATPLEAVKHRSSVPLRRRSLLVVFFAVALVGVALVVALGFGHFFAVDRCLDAGGSFNHVAGVCEPERSVPRAG